MGRLGALVTSRGPTTVVGLLKASARRTARANALIDVHTVGCERVEAESHAFAKNGQRAAEASAARAAEAAASDRALVLLRLDP